MRMAPAFANVVNRLAEAVVCFNFIVFAHKRQSITTRTN